MSITLADSVTSIAENAFDNCDNSIKIYCYRGSYAESWAFRKGYMVDYINEETEIKKGLHLDDDEVWRYYEKNQFVEFTGVLDFEGWQFFVADGILCSDANGLAEYGDKWYFLAAGQVQSQLYRPCIV